jgi:hypothetical protein
MAVTEHVNIYVMKIIIYVRLIMYNLGNNMSLC